MKRILALVDSFTPGIKGGGPAKSIANLICRIGDEFAFMVVTADHDVGDTHPYPGIISGNWTKVGSVTVIYLSKRKRFRTLVRVLREADWDVLYLNSFLHKWFTIVPLICRWFGIIPKRPVVVAPRGEFSPGALRIKYLKKKIYITCARLMKLYDKVVWQASSTLEESHIRAWFGGRARVTRAPIIVAPDLVAASISSATAERTKETGHLRVVFVSRIARKKNLAYALKILRELRGHVSMEIFGPIEDPHYWRECLDEIARLPSNINVAYGGTLTHDKTPLAFREADVFLFPTLGENFGH